MKAEQAYKIAAEIRALNYEPGYWESLLHAIEMAANKGQLQLEWNEDADPGILFPQGVFASRLRSLGYKVERRSLGLPNGGRDSGRMDFNLVVSWGDF